MSSSAPSLGPARTPPAQQASSSSTTSGIRHVNGRLHRTTGDPGALGRRFRRCPPVISASESRHHHVHRTLRFGPPTSFHWRAHVTVEVPWVGPVTSDVAWGGNSSSSSCRSIPGPLNPTLETLTDATWRIRQAVNAQGFPEVDHVELFARHQTLAGTLAEFCPVPRRRPVSCGTGTSAKLACLADTNWRRGGLDRRASSSTFTGRFRWLDCPGGPQPTIHRHCVCHRRIQAPPRRIDPFCWGIRNRVRLDPRKRTGTSATRPHTPFKYDCCTVAPNPGGLCSTPVYSLTQTRGQDIHRPSEGTANPTTCSSAESLLSPRSDRN